MRKIFRQVQMILSFRIAHITNADACCNGLQFAIVVYLTCQTIKRMVCQYKFNDIFPESGNFFRVGINKGIRNNWCVTGGYCFARAVFFQGDLHTAYSA